VYTVVLFFFVYNIITKKGGDIIKKLSKKLFLTTISIGVVLGSIVAANVFANSPTDTPASKYHRLDFDDSELKEINNSVKIIHTPFGKFNRTYDYEQIIPVTQVVYSLEDINAETQLLILEGDLLYLK